MERRVVATGRAKRNPDTAPQAMVRSEGAEESFEHCHITTRDSAFSQTHFALEYRVAHFDLSALKLHQKRLTK